MDSEYMDTCECSLSLQQLEQMDQSEYVLVDIREERAYQHGFIPGAIHMDMEAVSAEDCTLPKEKKIVFVLLKGCDQRGSGRDFREKGYMAYSLAGGYGAWLIQTMKKEEQGQGRLEEI